MSAATSTAKTAAAPGTETVPAMPRPQRLPLVPRYRGQGYRAEDLEARRRWVEKTTGCRFEHVAAGTVPGEAMRPNIENALGTAQVPLGVAGPLLVRGEHADGVFYVPMALTKGAIVRSYERGMVAVSRAGGVSVRLEADENRIAPIFFFEDVESAHAFASGIPACFESLRSEAEATTRHGRLLRVTPRTVGREVILDMVFSTGDALGMNLVVKAAERACAWLRTHRGAPRYSIFSAHDSEKRASASLFAGGKGKRVVAGVKVPAAIVRTVLHTTPRQLADNCRHSMVGHLASGALGCNVHLANGLAAIFIACGQDVANLANSGVGMTQLEETPEGDLYASLTLPSLSVATVGSGTGLGTARECLEMLGCAGPGKAPRLAEVVTAALLAGELSLAAAIAAGDFAEAQRRYSQKPGRQGEEPADGSGRSEEAK